ncbi:hypothetical protein DevBK_00075 [Devosia sp. BK]|uniref:hypothetical protein n=1 Tax=Devosia sp. BK TaxID=2871706 RepID=UPI00293AB5B9|nr:hypothetical protein [Devosia sp. BK]MDV3249715.1 hypothetical protein [Devosia sp. BK]
MSNKMKKDDLAETAKLLKETQRSLTKMQLGAQTPAARSEALLQKRARVEVAEIKGDLAIKGSLARICDEIGLHRCRLDTSALRGAMLVAMDNDRDAATIQRFHDRDAEFQNSRKRVKPGVSAFVVAAAPSHELVEKAREIGLKADLLVGGFKGRAALTDLIDLGERFSSTIRVEIKKTAYLLVNAGKVDSAVCNMLVQNDVGILADTTEPSKDNEEVVGKPGEGTDVMDNKPTMETVAADSARHHQARSMGNSGRRSVITGPMRPT